jgi:hypothetical protein
VADYCENGIESSHSIKGGEFPDQLSEYEFLKRTLFQALVISAIR